MHCETFSKYSNSTFHSLYNSKGPVPGAAYAAKVLNSGEVSVAMPPFEFTWSRTSTGQHKMELLFGWAYVTAAASVRQSAFSNRSSDETDSSSDAAKECL